MRRRRPEQAQEKAQGTRRRPRGQGQAWDRASRRDRPQEKAQGTRRRPRMRRSRL